MSSVNFCRIFSLSFDTVSQTTHVVLSVGAADGCAVHMAKSMMTTSPALKHALLLQVRAFVARFTPTIV